MAQLRQDYANFEAENTTIIAVGPENTKEFAKYWEENSIPFIGLPDPKHSVLKLYGQEVRLFKLGRMAQFYRFNGQSRLSSYDAEPGLIIISHKAGVDGIRFGTVDFNGISLQDQIADGEDVPPVIDDHTVSFALGS